MKLNDPLFFFGDSTTGRIAKTLNWSETPVGDPTSWPQELKIILGMIYHNLHPVCFYWGQENIFFYNDGFIPIVGESKHPWAIGKKGEDVWAEIWDTLSPQVELVMNHAKSSWNEDQYLPIIGNNGQMREAYFTYSFSPTFLNDGSVAGTIVTCTETTQKVINDKKITEAQIAFEKNVDTSPAMLWITEADGYCTYLSKQWLEHTGQTPEDGLGYGWLEMTHPDDKARSGEAFINANKNKTYFRTEYRLHNKDGSYRWAIDAGNPRFDKHGNYIGMAGTVFDVHERKMAEERAEEAKTRALKLAKDLNDVLETLPVPFYITDLDWKVTYINPSATDPFEMSKQEALGKVLWDLFPGFENTTIASELKRAKNDHIRVEHEGHYPEFDKWYHCWAYPFATGTAVVFIDSTAQVLARHRNERLANELKEAVRGRDEFLSIASHELKTPLTSLKLQTDVHKRSILKKDPSAYEPKRIDETIHQTEKQIARITRLIDDMLDVSRIRSGKLNIEREPFDFGELVQDVIERLKNQFTNSSYEMPEVLRCDHAEGNWDRLRMEQVITNLFTNAIRYGNKKSIKISIESDQSIVRLIVKDHGIGIAQEARTKIFNRFERAINANEVSGLGLGLFISKQIVEAHGGNIWVESEVGKGSTFYVEVPKEASNES